MAKDEYKWAAKEEQIYNRNKYFLDIWEHSYLKESVGNERNYHQLFKISMLECFVYLQTIGNLVKTV